jgi:hypothetical protein
MYVSYHEQFITGCSLVNYTTKPEHTDYYQIPYFFNQNYLELNKIRDLNKIF